MMVMLIVILTITIPTSLKPSIAPASSLKHHYHYFDPSIKILLLIFCFLPAILCPSLPLHIICVFSFNC